MAANNGWTIKETNAYNRSQTYQSTKQNLDIFILEHRLPIRTRDVIVSSLPDFVYDLFCCVDIKTAIFSVPRDESQSRQAQIQASSPEAFENLVNRVTPLRANLASGDDSGPGQPKNSSSQI